MIYSFIKSTRWLPYTVFTMGIILSSACLPERAYEGLDAETCSDQEDNDDDGAIDCADTDCQAQPMCEGADTDTDTDSTTDCAQNAEEVMGSNGPVDCVAQSDGSTCFVVCEGNESWENAHSACQEAGHDGLVSLLAESEDALVQDMIGGVDQAYWLGLKPPYTQWVNGEPVTYENWQPGQPNGAECTYLHMTHWGDGGCTTAYPFVCETRAASSNAMRAGDTTRLPPGLDDTGGSFDLRSPK